MAASTVFWNFAGPTKRSAREGVWKRAQVGEVHNSNSNLEMKHV